MKHVDNTYVITSKVAYLIGIDRPLFESPKFSFQMGAFEELEQNKSARIVRHLSRIRTAIYRRFSEIDHELRYNLKTIETIPQYIPADSVQQLRKDGIVLYRANCLLERYIIDINRLMIEFINNCRDLFPLWIKWEYLKDLFIVKNGMTTAGNKEACRQYQTHYDWYPFQQFINWVPQDYGSLLFNDRKFVTLLYEMNDDFFQDLSNVTDATTRTKDGIYRFLEGSENTVIVVDCENSDPYKIYAMLSSLDGTALDRISRIILFDDVHTTPAWHVLENFIDIPVTHNVITRVKQDKSLVDAAMIASICQEFYVNNADSFILCASDSDYWGLISVLQQARFWVCIEEYKCGPDIKSVMREHGISYCFLDNFYTGLNDKLKIKVLQEQLKMKLNTYQFNIEALLREVYWETHLEMSDEEKKRFYDKYVKSMRLVIDDGGEVHIELPHLNEKR